MFLDALTLMAAGSFVALLSSLVLLAAWTQIRSAPALLWWAAAQLAAAVGVGLLAAGFASQATAVMAGGSACIIASPVLIWAGVRKFNGRPIHWLALAAGPAVWLATNLLPLAGDPQVTARAIEFAVSVAYMLAAVAELWHGRAEALMARWPLMAIFTLHAAIFTGGIVDVLNGQVSPNNQVPPLGSWFSLIHFEQMIFLVGSAVFMVVLTRERVELGYKQASRLDELTGVANRRAFFESGERLLRRCLADSSPCSVVVFDLDHFKQINDTHGHAAGDRVLRTFADIARATLRPNDLFGRQGGEEFAVILPGTGIDVAYVIAERFRQAFATTGENPDVATSRPTVSAGVARVEGEAGLETTMEVADHALYRAKRLGRNRVERIDPGDGDGDGKTNIVRVA